MTRVVRRFALAVLVGSPVFLAQGGCRSSQPEPVDFSPSERHFRSDEYGDVLRRWTRHTKLLGDVGTILEVWAVLKSPEFREAYVERYAEVYHLPEEREDTLHELQLRESKASYEFHVTAQSTDWRWNDFEKSGSAWRIALVDGAGNELAPSTIKVEKLPQPYVAGFFPYETPFTRTYTIKFDISDGDEQTPAFVGPATGRLTLRFASPVGETSLVWQAK